MTSAARGGVRGRIEEVLSLDLRSLAIFRVGLSLVLLYDLFDRSRSLVAHYTDQGVMPAEQAVAMFGRGVYGSIYYYASGSVFAVGCLFIFAALCAGALLVGYRTRLATALSWYLLASLQVRNDWTNGLSGDTLLLALLFWGVFLPLGARGSVDARRPARVPGNRVRSVATAGYLAQLFVVYFSTGLLKSGEAWSDGSAVFYALQLGHFETPFTHLLFAQGWTLPFLTRATLVLEIAGPFLIFFPLRVPVVRMLAVAIFVGFHLSLAVFLNVGPFPIICIAAWLALLPGALFDDWIPRLRFGASARTRAASASAASEAVPQAVGMARWIDLALLLPLLFVVTQTAVKLGWLDLGYGKTLPPFAHAFGQLTRLNQNWGMFSPDPSRYTLWLGVEGRLASGESVDPFARGPVHRRIPADIAGSSRSYRWRAYTWTALLTRPSRPTLEASHRDFAAFLCREWNTSLTDEQEEQGGQRLEELRSIGFWRQSTDRGPVDLRPTVLYEYRCGGSGKLVWQAAQNQR